ncbi:hypothetical protein OZX74_03740 [Bifidobacterium sp. ESL0798]|uniref:hypothetical protein n=1 Tax=Bifidobacterium sp. ESL0798 TaxID=2983235 RepID=UPI0023F991EA|nr:hypothetical protein [Bifidobacterium sp. ESL0798]WEV74639.1 hypothetical protein OZX74_03740 [Bifidobacterium sp. ESL0798]
MSEVNAISRQASNVQSGNCRKRDGGRMNVYKYYDALSDFDLLFDDLMADGRFDGLMPVRDTNGECPMVTALGEERLCFLFERVRATGGCANVFVKSKGRIMPISFTRVVSVSEETEVMSDESEWLDGDSRIDAFIDYLRARPDGIVLSGKLSKGSSMHIIPSKEEVPIDKS